MQDIQPIKVRDLPRFLKAIEPIAADLASAVPASGDPASAVPASGDPASIDIVGVLIRHADAVIEATAIGASVDRAWLEDQTPDVLAELAAKVLEVNADFFFRRVLPAIQGAADRLTQSVQTASGGTSGSPPSSMPDSATAT